MKFGCGDWKCCQVALIFFSHWFLPFARSFNLVQKSMVRTSKVASLQFYKSKGYLPFGRILQSSVNHVKLLYQIFFSFWKLRHICFVCHGLNVRCWQEGTDLISLEEKAPVYLAPKQFFRSNLSVFVVWNTSETKSAASAIQPKGLPCSLKINWYGAGREGKTTDKHLRVLLKEFHS